MSDVRIKVGRRAVLGGGTALVATGCWGSFNLTGKVYDWNGHFDSKWVSWLVFLAFIILPVYSILLLVDALVINTIEFYSGNNPVKRNADLGGGNHLVFTPTDNPDKVHVQHQKHGKVVSELYIERLGDDEFRLLDAKGRQLTHAATDPQGRISLRDRLGRRIAHLTRRQQRDAVDAAMRGDSVAAAVYEGVEANGQADRILAMAETSSGRAAI